MEVPIDEDGISTNSPVKTVDLPASVFSWDVASDGKRFLLHVQDNLKSGDDDRVNEEHNVVRVIANFFTVLNEKVPPSHSP